MVGRVLESENTFNDCRLVHKVDVAFSGGGFRLAMNALDVVPRARVVLVM